VGQARPASRTWCAGSAPRSSRWPSNQRGKDSGYAGAVLDVGQARPAAHLVRRICTTLQPLAI
ncbi:hypothetical protein, partial [Pseudomonas syringae]|uniref:hypothetical protein n=1 Tax=Pseudomonas syringae TaxID=317 RepID=UPI001CA4F1BD